MNQARNRIKDYIVLIRNLLLYFKFVIISDRILPFIGAVLNPDPELLYAVYRKLDGFNLEMMKYFLGHQKLIVQN